MSTPLRTGPAVLWLGAAVSMVAVLTVFGRYPLHYGGWLPTFAMYSVACALGIGAGTARARSDALLRRREHADVEAATAAQRTEIALELQREVAWRLRAVTELAEDAERGARPAERFAEIQRQARHALTGMRRMLRLLRDPELGRSPPEPAVDPVPGVRRWRPSTGDVAIAMSTMAVMLVLHLLLPAEAPAGVPPAIWAFWRLPDGLLGMLAVIVQVAPLAWRRRAPAWALAASTVGIVLAPLVAGFSAVAAYARVFLVYSTATWASRRTCLLVIPLAETAQQLSVAFLPAAVPLAFPQTPGTIVYDVLVVAALWLAGDARRRTRATIEHAERGERADRVHRSLREQRLRLARELHDGLAHHISGVAVQAGAARTVLDRDPDGIGVIATAIRTEAGTALGALPDLLAVLDPLRPDDRTDDCPELGATELTELARPLRDAGADVTVELRGEPERAAPTSSIFARGIAREALTNVLRHAGPTRTRLVLEHHVDRTVLEVSDNGPGAEHRPAVPSGGHGLLGMHERAAALGGELQAGPRGDGGWTVRAELPHEPETSPPPSAVQ